MSVRAGAVPGSRPLAPPAEAAAGPAVPAQAHRPLHAVLTTGLAAGAADLVAKATPAPEPVRRLERVPPAPAPVAAVFDGLTLRHGGAEAEEEAETGMFNRFTRKVRSAAGMAASTAEVAVRADWDLYPSVKKLPTAKFSVDCVLWDAGCEYVFYKMTDKTFDTTRFWNGEGAPAGFENTGTAILANMMGMPAAVEALPYGFKTGMMSEMEKADHALKAVRLVNEAYKALKEAGETGMDAARYKTNSFPDVMHLTIGGDLKDYDADRGSKRGRVSPFVLKTDLFKGKSIKTAEYNFNVELNTIASTDYIAAFKAIKQYAGTKKMLLIGEDTGKQGENGRAPDAEDEGEE